MRKHWKHENIVNVRIALMRKSRKAVKFNAPAPKSAVLKVAKPHPKRVEMQDAMIYVKELIGLAAAKSILADFFYEKLADVKDCDVVPILRRANNAIYGFTHSPVKPLNR